MGKISNKSRYNQLMSWLEGRKNAKKHSSNKTESRISYYKSKNA